MSIIHIAFYPSDWLAGTRALSDTETGVYITLIAHMYEMAGPIERDDERLARMCGCRTKSSFLKSLNHLIAVGKIIEADGTLFNERAGKELQNTTEKSSKAKAAAESRWSRKPNKNNVDPHAYASPKHMPQTCQSESESDIREDTSVSSVVSLPDGVADCLAHFNATAERVGWPQVQKFSKPRRAALSHRIKDVGGPEAWRSAIDRAAASPHLTGQNNRGWAADFDWLAKPANFTKLMEGNYDPRNSNGNPKHPSQGGKRSDPALENILRLAGVGQASCAGGS